MPRISSSKGTSNNSIRTIEPIPKVGPDFTVGPSGFETALEHRKPSDPDTESDEERIFLQRLLLNPSSKSSGSNLESPNVLTFSVVEQQEGDDLKPIFDGGANRNIFPQDYPGLSDFKPRPSTATMADGISSLNVHGRGKFGVFDVVIADVPRPIISEPSMLTQFTQLSIEKRGKHMYIIDGNSIISTGTLSSNIGLYTVDDIETLLIWEPDSHIEIGITCLLPAKRVLEDDLSATAEDTSTNPLANANPEFLRNGSYRAPYGPARAGVQEIDVLHVIWGHPPEREIKRIVKHKLVAGSHYAYDKIKNQHLRMCHTCMIARMRSFSVPRSIAPIIVYDPFTYISFDVVSFKIRSRGGYLHIVLYVDRKTGTLFAFKCRFKSELLSTLKRLILEHGPAVNSKAS